MDHILIPVDVHPGPLDPSLLSRQGEHRSSLVWAGEEPSFSTSLLFRRRDGHFWEAYSRADPRVRDMIDMAGFAGICRVGFMQVDHALITALVERWRPETHTFHLPIGEATVTLQDIVVLWGLRVDGDPIIGGKATNKKPGWVNQCLRVLGYQPELRDIDGNRLYARSLEAVIDTPLQPDASEQDIAYRARCFIMLLFGGLLFSDKSGKFVPLRFLPLVEDLQRCGTLSWGSGVLAYMYRCLCEAAKGNAQQICGPMVLLQLWVYEHISILRPTREMPLFELPDLAPIGARWNRPYDLRKLPTHVLRTYRDQLDALRTDQFIWMPYEEIIQTLPTLFLDGSEIWRSSPVPLICWEIVEYCFPDRVMRQFGHEQHIPMMHDHFYTHTIRLRGINETIWEAKHRRYIDEWVDRHHRILTGVPADQVIVAAPEYMDWYLVRTRLMISNPHVREHLPEGYQTMGAALHSLASTVRQSLVIIDDAIPHANTHSHGVLTMLQEKMSRTLSSIGSVGSSRRVDVDTAPIPPISQRPRQKIDARGQPGVRRGGRRPRGQAQLVETEPEAQSDVYQPEPEQADDVDDQAPIPLFMTWTFLDGDDRVGPLHDADAPRLLGTQVDDGVITQLDRGSSPMQTDIVAPGRRRDRSDDDPDALDLRRRGSRARRLSDHYTSSTNDP